MENTEGKDSYSSSYLQNIEFHIYCQQQENYYIISVDYHRFIVSSIWKST
jgi:hypothetical protein